MRKKVFVALSIAALIFYVDHALAQIEKCGTMYVLEQHKKKDPGLIFKMEKTRKTAKAWEKKSAYKTASNIVTIPVVVHVIYYVDSLQQNIPDSVIYSQIEVLNEDFRRLNADTVNTRPVFDTIAADIGVEFCMATVDPDGYPTNGIIRTETSVDGFDIFTMMDEMKFTSSGGQDAWPADQYLNIWTCYMTVFGMPGVLGYAQFPGDDPATDGVVILYNYFGRANDPNSAPGSFGRTTSHEVGHWMGLYHIWGNVVFGGSCDSIDYVDDTPSAYTQSNFDCNFTINSCSNESPYWGIIDPPDMVENYMDYSNDTCMNSFTQGQKDRMMSFLYTDRVSLLTSNGCETINAINDLFHESDSKVFLSPVPSSGILNVMVNPAMEGISIEILNILGQVVDGVKSNDEKYLIPILQQRTFAFDLSDLPAGFYFVNINSMNGSIVKKFVLEE